MLRFEVDVYKTKAAKPRPTAAPIAATLLLPPKRASAPEAGRAECEAEADAAADLADEWDATDFDEAAAERAEDADGLAEFDEAALMAREEAEVTTARVEERVAGETAVRLIE